MDHRLSYNLGVFPMLCASSSKIMRRIESLCLKQFGLVPHVIEVCYLCIVVPICLLNTQPLPE
jgi:hypothetical protein